MKSNFKEVGTILEHGELKKVYYSKNNNKYYSLGEGPIVEEITGSSLIGTKVADYLGEKVRKKRMWHNGLIYGLSLTTILAASSFAGIYANSNPETIGYIIDDDKSLDDVIYLFQEKLNKNNTINEEQANILLSYLETLYNKSNIDFIHTLGIAHRLETLDFSIYQEENFIDELENVIANKGTLLSYMAASSLYNYQNNLPNKSCTKCFSEIMSLVDEDAMSLIINNQEDKLYESIAKSYGITKLRAKHLIEALYQKSEIEFFDMYRNILIKRAQNQITLSSYEQLMLVSDIFGGDYYIENNLLSDEIVVLNASKDFSYNQYFKKGSFKETTKEHYIKELETMMNNTEANYQDADYRFLMYLYFYYEYINFEEVPNPKAQELYELIVEESRFPKEIIYQYLTSSYIDPSKLLFIKPQGILFNLDEDKLALFQEFLLCLEEEAKSNSFFNRELDAYIKDFAATLQEVCPELYEKWVTSHKTHSSMLDELITFGKTKEEYTLKYPSE